MTISAFKDMNYQLCSASGRKNRNAPTREQKMHNYALICCRAVAEHVFNSIKHFRIVNDTIRH
jgi:hypothetical protein